jgi:anti-sigma regulatory factor (Ser/Thr protein kinase)
MRTGAAAGHRGYFHEAASVRSDEELLAILVPFLTGGSDAGEPTLVALSERNAALVRSALPAGTGVEFIPRGDMYTRPAAAIRAFQRLFAGHVAAGARQIRIAGELGPATYGRTWDWWARYESAINHAYDDFPVWGICLYDTRTAPAEVLRDVARTHPRAALPDGRHVPSPPYTPPATYLTEPRPPAPDPVQDRPPVVHLTAPTPAEARRAVRQADRGILPADAVEDLVVAVSEAVTNALLHGRPPVSMRIWHGPDRIVVAVTDGGDGPKDPFAGLLPADSEPGGRGLWITDMSCDHVARQHTEKGFTLRLTAGNPH